MKRFFQKILAECSGDSDLRHRHPFLMLYLRNGSVFTASAKEDSGEFFLTHLFRLGRSHPNRPGMTLIPVHPFTHIACPKSPVMVDLHSFCGLQRVDPEKLTKRPLHDTACSLSEPANNTPDVQKTDPDDDKVLPERMEISEPITVIPIERIKKITIKPHKWK